MYFCCFDVKFFKNADVVGIFTFQNVEICAEERVFAGKPFPI